MLGILQRRGASQVRARRVLLSLLWISLAPALTVAAPLTNVSFVPDDDTTGVTTSYTLSFTAASTVNNTDALRITQSTTTPSTIITNLDNATYVSTGSNLTVNIGSSTQTALYMVITGGSVSAGNTVTVRFSGIVNPADTTGSAYVVNVEDQGVYSARDQGTAPANSYTGNLGPVVTTLLPDFSGVEVQNGTFVAVSDLNDNFTDGDGDPLTFSVATQGNAAVATATVVGDRLDVTPVGFGTTNITIEADDNDDGTITDTFSVSVLGLLTNASVTPGSLETGATTSYTLSFTPDTTISSGDFIILSTAAGGPNQASSTLGSISGGSLAGTITNQSATSTVVNFSSGSATSSQPVTIALNNIVNPGSAITGPDFVIRKTDGSSTLDQVRLPGATYTSGSLPTVSSPIADQNLDAQDGEQTIVSDLDTVFTDGDGDPLTFAVLSSSVPAVATARLVGDALLINPLSFGTTTITVEADDNTAGTVTDAFDVTVRGLLTPANVVPASLEANTTNSVTITFTPSQALTSSDQVLVVFPNTFDTSSTTLSSVNPATATLQVFPNAFTPVLQLTSGSFASGQLVTIVLDSITNPPTSGSPGNYSIQTQDFGDSPYDFATIAGDTFFGGVNAPRLDNPIADQTRAVESGPTVLVADLNTVFSDGNGDTLDFSVTNVSNPGAATASIDGDELTITPIGSGSSTITIEASDTVDTATDQFVITSLGQLLPADVTPASLAATETMDYTVSLTPDINLGVGRQIVINLPSGFDASGATLTDVSPNTAQFNLAASAQQLILEVLTGSITSSSLVSVSLSGVTNPAIGTGGSYVLQLRDPSENVTGISTLAGDTFFDPTFVPSVSAAIDDQVLALENGPAVVVNDLNTVFTDGDGDPLTFDVLPGNDTAVATAAVATNQLTVTPVGAGVTTITVQASDGDEGEATDAFDVRVLGLLTPADVTPASLDANTSGVVDVSLTPSSTVALADQVTVSFPAGFDLTAATLASNTAGIGLTLGTTADTATLTIASGVVNPGNSLDFSLDNVAYPEASGNPGDYVLQVIDDVAGPVGQATVAGDTFVGGVNAPSVVNPIDDLNLDAENGEVEIGDLETVFQDGNGDPLTFSIESQSDTAVAQATLDGSVLSVLPLATGTTTIVVQADDQIDQPAQDTFEVTVIGAVAPATVTPDSLLVSESTELQVTLTPGVALTAGDAISITLPAGFDSSAATLAGAAPPGTTLSLTPGNPLQVSLTSGSITAGTATSLSFGDVVNPAARGTTGTFTIETLDGVAAVTGRSTIVGVDLIDPPTVVAPIDDQQLFEEDGVATVVADLNTVFEDSDPLTFSIFSQSDTGVADAVLDGNALRVTPLAGGTSTVVVRADDGIDGFVDDTFAITVIADLGTAGFNLDNNAATVMTNAVITLTPSVELGAGDLIRITVPLGFDTSAADLLTLLPAGATASLTSTDPLEVTLSAGTIAAGTPLTLTIADLLNPLSAGPTGDVVIETSTGGGDVTGRATVAGAVISDPPELIFLNGFEALVLTPKALSVIVGESSSGGVDLTYAGDADAFNLGGHRLSRLVHNGQPRSAVEVLRWIQDTLAREFPGEDWDGDGLPNRTDRDPLGLAER